MNQSSEISIDSADRRKAGRLADGGSLSLIFRLK
jgi:hypothetical protein